MPQKQDPSKLSSQLVEGENGLKPLHPFEHQKPSHPLGEPLFSEEIVAKLVLIHTPDPRREGWD